VNVKQGRLQEVAGLALVGVGLVVLFHWALFTETLRNGQPLLSVLLVVVGVLIHRRSNSG
jgi:uncharacterized membrane protein